MKKLKIFLLILLFCLSMAFISCNNDLAESNNTENIENIIKPSTEIFVQGQYLLDRDEMYSAQTRASSSVLSWPYVSNDGWESARFSIRADGVLPGYIDQSSTLYYGRSAGKPGNNRGRVYTIYPYGHYNDRDYDYYKKNQKTGNNIGLFRYVYDETGMKTQLALLEVPSVVDILGDEVIDLNNEINAGKNVTKNTNILNDVNNLLNKGAEYLDSHVLWYVVKEVAYKNAWHVNGVIKDYEISKPTISNIPNNVEIDIHQQIHEDWNEIKTSIHIRAACESIKINIPLNYEDIVEQDDFNIRIYDFYYKEYIINHTITHDNNGITIEITNIPSSLIDELKTNFGDGLTVEIHSYCTRKDIWDQLSKSYVINTGKPCTVNGQITSAYKEGEKIDIKVMKP